MIKVLTSHGFTVLVVYPNVLALSIAFVKC